MEKNKLLDESRRGATILQQDQGRSQRERGTRVSSIEKQCPFLGGWGREEDNRDNREGQRIPIKRDIYLHAITTSYDSITHSLSVKRKCNCSFIASNIRVSRGRPKTSYFKREKIEKNRSCSFHLERNFQEFFFSRGNLFIYSKIG